MQARCAVQRYRESLIGYRTGYDGELMNISRTMSVRCEGDVDTGEDMTEDTQLDFACSPAT